MSGLQGPAPDTRRIIRRCLGRVLVLEKPGCPPCIYVDSGTQSETGLELRFRDYDELRILSRFTAAAVDEGYEIVHKGVICWLPIPDSTAYVSTLALILLLEALFSIIFWAMKS